MSIASTLKDFSEFGFKRIFERVDIKLHGMESPVYFPVGEGKEGPTNHTITILITSFRGE